MARRFDPLSIIPPAKAIKTEVVATERLLARLRKLLTVAEEIEAETPIDSKAIDQPQSPVPTK